MKLWFTKLLYFARDLRSRKLFEAVAEQPLGTVLDVGGWDFYLTAEAHGARFTSWTVLDLPDKQPASIADPRIKFISGDGCNMDFPDGSFDTVLSVQVLEHVFDAQQMVAEMCRVLKPGGKLVLLVPQTSTLHMAPHHYYNFTRYWVAEVLRRNNMETVSLLPLGGRWSSTASHLVYFFLQSLRRSGMWIPEYRRSPWFYLLFPFMALFACVAIPICLIFSLADLREEPNNHLAVARKPEAPR